MVVVMVVGMMIVMMIVMMVNDGDDDGLRFAVGVDRERCSRLCMYVYSKSLILPIGFAFALSPDWFVGEALVFIYSF